VPEALGKPRKTVGKEGSANSTLAKTSLSSTFSQALGKDFAECQAVLGKEKRSSRRQGDGDDVFAKCSRGHSAKKLPLPSVYRPTPGKEFARGSLCQFLCRVLCLALGKACIFTECQGYHTWQRSYTGAQVLVLCRVLLSHPVLEGKPNANYVRARIRTHVHSDYINEHHHTMLE
jgi:hypothetical protein